MLLLITKGARELFAKASIPSGARWITVHPHGEGKGTPVLIQETQRGSGVYHVVGGAGGKLNYLKLRGVKHPDDYAKDVREKQGARRDAKREQRRQEKESGVHEQRQAERAAIDAARTDQEKAFIQEVAQAVGWDAADMALPADQVDGLSDEARRAAELKHHRQLLSKARETADLQRRALELDADARAARDLGEYEAEEPGKRGLGYTPAYGERTSDQAADISDEATKIDAARRTDDDRARSANTKERAAKIKLELDSVTTRAGELKAKVLDTAKAIKVLQAAKKMRAAQKKAADAKRAVDRGESKAYVIKVGDEPSEADIQRDVDNDLRTRRTRAFLGEVGKIDSYEDALGRHIGVGAHNGLNAVSLATAGIGIVDRDAVDVLGIAGAAQTMAARLRADLSPEQLEQATAALEQYHVDHYMQRSDEALREAGELEAAAREIEAGENADGHDLAEAHELHAQRQQALGEARRVLGVALGEMEAHAALLTAMQAKDTKPLDVPLGHLATEDAVRRLRAIGLERGDYQIQHAGAEVIARVSPEGMLRVAKPIDGEHMDRMRTSLDIIEGRRDEANFWPKGVANRPDLALPDAPELRPDPLAEPFEAGPDLGQSLREHIGSRMADGHAIGDIVRDLHTQAMAEKSGDRQADYFRALGDVVPLKDKAGKLVENEDRRAAFTKMADDWAQSRGGKFSPLHAQDFAVDKHSIEALHRAFADEPTGTVAFKPVGDLTAQDQTALRRYFDQNIAHEDTAVAGVRQELDAHGTAEPERETDDMFGRGTNPAWTAWKQHGDELRQKITDAGLNWNKYSQLMGGPAAAYGAIQDHVRGRVVQQFAATHNRLNPDKPVRVGRTVLQNNLRHLDAVDPSARDKRLQQQRELIDGLRSRDGGRYASGSVVDKLDASRERQAALEQSQLGFFAASDEPATAERPLAPDERHTVGAAAERRLAQMAPLVGQNFKPGQPVKVWQPSMTGKFVAQQRAIKLIDANKRVLLAQGVGSGKTSMGLGAFAHVQQQGKAKRGMFIVPSIVQGQFGAEASAMLEPGKFKWHAQPGASRAERLAAYRDPKTHFNVITHQAFRDDMIHLGAQRAGINEQQMAEQVRAMAPAERQKWAAEAMQHGGIDHDYFMVDEGDTLLNRAGKEDSTLASVADAATANVPYYVSASADPIRNDPSEIFDVLRKMDPKRYTDRAAFMRKYGIDTQSAKDALRREMAPYLFPGRISPGVQVKRNTTPVELSAPQRDEIEKIEQHVADVRMARLEGKTNVEAARALSPHSFAGADPAEHDAIAKRLAESIGVLRDTAVDRAINSHPESAKLDAVDAHVKARAGKPGVIFARSLDAVSSIAKRLTAQGHRVVTITGKDSAKQKAEKRLKFKPEKGEPEADILIASDAGAVGMNAQRGQWLLQYDTPQTARTHAQRNGRIERLGQHNPEIELTDLVANHESERRARKRLKTKYGLRDIVTSPLDGLDDTGFAAYLSRARAATAAQTDIKEAA